MKKFLLVTSFCFGLFFAACQTPVEDEEVKRAETMEELATPLKEAQTEKPVDPTDFFASLLFDQGEGGTYNVIYPYDVENVDTWVSEVYETLDNWELSAEERSAQYKLLGDQLDKDYEKFDPLLLFENDPETLVKNYKGYEGQETLTLNEVLHMQALKETLEVMLTQSERWQPSSTATTLTPPEGYPGWYGPSEDGEPYPIQSLLYVEWDTWEKINARTWKEMNYSWDWEREDEVITFYDNRDWSSFAHQPNENGFFLAGSSSYSYFNMDGGGSAMHDTIYAYDPKGRLQESLQVVNGVSGSCDTIFFEFTSYGYDANARLDGVRVSNVSLGCNQLLVPQLIYEQKRYWAQEPLLH